MAEKTPEKKSASPYKKNSSLYKKSRYYKERQKRLRIGGSIFAGALAIFLIGALSVHLLHSERSTSKETMASQSADNSAADTAVSGEASGTDDGKATADMAASDSEEGTSDDGSDVMDPVSITVSVVGDCTLGTDPAFDYSTSLNQYFYDYGPAYFLENVKSYFENDDLTIANLEGAFTESDDQQDKEYTFKAPAEFTQILTEGSVEAVNTANNHSHDFGDSGFEDTLSALDDAGIVHFGYDETAVYEVKGIKIGLVGIYELKDHLDREQQLKDNIQAVKDEGADLIIVIFHWGNERETYPDDNQLTLGHLAIDEGADLVCGHHPHVLQGIETYKGKNIVYSLGNFCFGGNSAPSDMDTMIYQQTFTIIADGVADDLVTNIVPCSLSSELYYNNYQPTPAEGDEAQRILDKIEERSSWIPEYTPASDDSSEDTSEELSDDSSEDSADEISE